MVLEVRAMKRMCYSVAVLLFLCAAGCGSSGGGGGVVVPGIGASFSASGTASTPNGIRVTGTASGDLVTLQVAITGQTTSTDLYSFAFDLLLGDPTVVELIGGTVNFGTALTLSGVQTGEVLATLNGDRITVGVSKLGGGAGNAVGAAEETIVSVTVRVVQLGTTSIEITGSPPNNPAALDSTGAVINGLNFDGAAATIVGI